MGGCQGCSKVQSQYNVDREASRDSRQPGRRMATTRAGWSAHSVEACTSLPSLSFSTAWDMLGVVMTRNAGKLGSLWEGDQLSAPSKGNMTMPDR